LEIARSTPGVVRQPDASDALGRTGFSWRSCRTREPVVPRAGHEDRAARVGRVRLSLGSPATAGVADMALALEDEDWAKAAENLELLADGFPRSRLQPRS
jgi:hypothetical protein